MVKYNSELGGLKMSESDYNRIEKHEDENGKVYYLLPKNFVRGGYDEEFLDKLIKMLEENKTKKEMIAELNITIKKLDNYLFRKFGTSVLKTVESKIKGTL